MEKYGFVYLWRDKKHNKYYVGSHWGTETDGYICSSTNMRNNYRNRPLDFKRRILSKVFTNRQDLLQEEQRFLDMIHPEQFGRRYYNLTASSKPGSWWVNEETKRQVSAKMSAALKGKRCSPRTEFKPGQHPSPQTEFQKGQTAHNKGKSLIEQYGVDKAGEITTKLSLAKAGISRTSSSTFKKGQRPWNYGLSRILINNGLENKILYGTDVIPEGWVRGHIRRKVTPKNAFKKGHIPWNKKVV